MKSAEQKSYRQFVATWKSAGSELERNRREELAALGNLPNWKHLESLGDIGVRFAVPRTSSGLLEMQQWFLKVGRRQAKKVP